MALFGDLFLFFVYIHYSNFWAKLTKHYTLGLFFPSKMRKLRKTLLDYDFLRWLGSPLNITVRIWVAPFPQHWSLCTILDFGLNCPLFIFRASDWSQFWYGSKKIWHKETANSNWTPLCSAPLKAPNLSTPISYKMIQEDQSGFTIGQDDPGLLWRTSCNPKCLNSMDNKIRLGSPCTVFLTAKKKSASPSRPAKRFYGLDCIKKNGNQYSIDALA